MRLVGIDNLTPGMVTGRHLYTPGDTGGGIPLLAANVTLTESILQRLRRVGVTAVTIEDAQSEGIEVMPTLSDETRKQAIAVLRGTFSMMSAKSGTVSRDSLDDVESIISRILVEIASRRNLLVCLSDLNLFGGDQLQHALDVCVVGTAVARQFFRAHGWRDFKGQRREDGIEDRLVKLGIGLLLQDIGMLAVPESIRAKGGLLTAEERGISQQHPLLGLELLDGAELSPLTKVTIAHHHERYDGSGYPRALAGDDIHDHGQIAGIAEAYVTLRGETAAGGGPRLQPHDAYRVILQSRGRLFRPEVVDAFQAAVAPFEPGAAVRLVDGRYGIVVENHADAPLTPRVRVTHDADGVRFEPPLDVDLRREQGHAAIAEGCDGLPGDAGVDCVAV